MNGVGSQPALALERLTKRYGSVTAVDEVDLSVTEGEFLTLLGPSGSGKTTTLRMVAGFTTPSAGAIRLDGGDITEVPPNKRGVGMVFQNYALFPHMTAAQNVAFPLEMRRVPRAEVRRRVAAALDIVHLQGLAARKPRELSGGQQQRVALARAIVFQPRLLLMDEPLGALDRQLRETLQLEILSIRRRIGVTVLYVTHDQEEALAMSDRIAIFNNGRIEQIGHAEDLYVRPATWFVAKFVGESTMLYGRLARDAAGAAEVAGPLGRWRVALAAGSALRDRDDVALVIRPERLTMTAADDGTSSDASVEATIAEALYLGSTRRYDLVLADGTRALVREPTTDRHDRRTIGDRVRLTWRPQDAAVVAAPEGAPPQLDEDDPYHLEEPTVAASQT